MILALVVFLIAFPVLESYRDYLSFPISPEVSKEWHHTGFIIRAFTAILILIPYWTWIPLYAFYFWIVFDAFIYSKTHRVGTTAATDILLGKYSNYIKVVGLIASAIFLYMW